MDLELVQADTQVCRHIRQGDRVPSGKNCVTHLQAGLGCRVGGEPECHPHAVAFSCQLGPWCIAGRAGVSYSAKDEPSTRAGTRWSGYEEGGVAADVLPVGLSFEASPKCRGICQIVRVARTERDRWVTVGTVCLLAGRCRVGVHEKRSLVLRERAVRTLPAHVP